MKAGFFDIRYTRGTILRLTIASIAFVFLIFFGLLALFVVPAPKVNTARETKGILKSISAPQPEQGDMGIVLDNGQTFYINRANEIDHLDWEMMLAELTSGDEVLITYVTPLFWRLQPDSPKMSMPVAGLRTDEKVYLDAGIAADTWTSQRDYARLAILAMLVLVICIVPEFFRLYQWVLARKAAAN